MRENSGGHAFDGLALFGDVVERMELGTDLQRALDGDELVLHYQPTLELATDRIVGVEALLRWNHPRRGLLTAAQFVSLAETTELIHTIGAWVLRGACAQGAEWRNRRVGSPDLLINVNVSLRQLRNPSLVDEVTGALDHSRLAPEALVLELNEAILADAGAYSALLADLKALGVRLAIDDFHPTAESLGALRKVPVDVLKIDRDYIKRLGLSPADGELVTEVIRTGHGLGFETVAGGIERPAQLLLLHRMGIDYGQGHYYARPAPALEMALALADSVMGPDSSLGFSA